MFQPEHCGLYFSDDQLRQIRARPNAEPAATALALLRQRKPLDLLEIAQWSGLLYRFDDDIEAGARAVEILQQHDDWQTGVTLEQIATQMTWAQCFEMVRDHPQFKQKGDWLDRFAQAVTAVPEVPFVEQLWRNVLLMVASVVLEDAARFDQAAEQFKHTIQHDVHPDGYIRRAAAGEKGLSLHRMLLAAQALILTAEVASHAGTNLWAFGVRGVSALTPTPYLLYYYYYPEKWRWDADVDGDEVPEVGESLVSTVDVQALYQRHGGLWEMAQRQRYSQDRATLLDDLRPVIDVWGGGLVTLTHGMSEQKKRRFGLF